ncbi:MAG: TetR family transcriptional regulator [Candidatus Aminicenantaceae bacterium]
MGKKTLESDKEPRDRILEVAVRLFAQKGYAAVGVREIAGTAGVNISMISYYFEGKVGILKVIMGTFFEDYLKVFDVPEAESKSAEACALEIMRNLVGYVRANTDLALVAFNELPLEVPEIAEIKVEWVKRMLKRASWILVRLGLDPADGVQVGVVGPTLFSMVMMHFRIRHIQREVFGLDFDDAYYERFVSTASTLFLDGIHGIAAKNTA